MSISMFLKKRREKRLAKQRHNRKHFILEQIYKLKEEAAKLNASAQTSKRSAEETKAYVSIRQREAANGDWTSSVHLSCYLDEYLERIHRYENDYATFNQQYLNTLDKINRLEEELKSL